MALPGAGATGCSLAAVATGRLLIAQLGAVAAVLALPVAQLGSGLAGRQHRR